MSNTTNTASTPMAGSDLTNELVELIRSALSRGLSDSKIYTSLLACTSHFAVLVPSETVEDGPLKRAHRALIGLAVAYEAMKLKAPYGHE